MLYMVNIKVKKWGQIWFDFSCQTGISVFLKMLNILWYFLKNTAPIRVKLLHRSSYVTMSWEASLDLLW